MTEQCYHQSALYMVIKNQDLSKEQEAKRLLSSLGIKTQLNKIPLLGDILF